MSDQITARCDTCGGVIRWIDCPTGGWWSHEIHPADEHDATTTVEVEEDMDAQGWLHTVGVRGDQS
ncbi:hypothetical protein [Nocardia niwae]|uniref:hypothetical protein n=1 Tax=Nocardia niwae TaxID=626084 RepID=UPI0007A4EDAE|nr:hypothetical protein [Nocardia niwae]